MQRVPPATLHGHTGTLSADGEVWGHGLLDTLQTDGPPLSSAHEWWASASTILLNLQTKVYTLFRQLLRKGQGSRISPNGLCLLSYGGIALV